MTTALIVLPSATLTLAAMTLPSPSSLITTQHRAAPTALAARPALVEDCTLAPTAISYPVSAAECNSTRVELTVYCLSVRGFTNHADGSEPFTGNVVDGECIGSLNGLFATFNS